MDIADGPGVRVSIFSKVVHLIVKIVLIQKLMILMVERNLQIVQLIGF